MKWAAAAAPGEGVPVVRGWLPLPKWPEFCTLGDPPGPNPPPLPLREINGRRRRARRRVFLCLCMRDAILEEVPRQPDLMGCRQLAALKREKSSPVECMIRGGT